MFLSLSSLVAAVPAGASHPDQLRETRRELRAARARLSRLVQSDRQLSSLIHSLASQLATTRVRLADARDNLAELQAGIRTEQRRLERLRRMRSRRGEAMQGRVRQLYILGPGYSLESLFASASYDDFFARSAMLDFMNRRDRETVEEIAKLRHDSLKAREALVRERLRAARVRDHIAERESIQSEILAAKEEAESRLDSQISAERSEVISLAAEQARIEAFIRSAGSVSTGAVSRRGFVWPIRGAITSDYGPRHGGFHTGIDIDCETGDSIGASKRGRVIATGWQGGYGNAVIIDHGDGVSTLYAHMSSIYVNSGQDVAQRRKVGACGATGNASGDHLHFEVRINGEHTDPKPFLP